VADDEIVARSAAPRSESAQEVPLSERLDLRAVACYEKQPSPRLTHDASVWDASGRTAGVSWTPQWHRQFSVRSALNDVNCPVEQYGDALAVRVDVPLR